MYHASVLDSDLYKYSMGNFINTKHPRAQAEYTFINRDGREFPDGFGKKLTEIVDGFRGLQLQADERDFMREKCYYLPPVYTDFLMGYRYDPKNEVVINQIGPDLLVKVRGPMYRTIYWEVPLMATISELYFQETGRTTMTDQQIMDEAGKKGQGLNNIGVIFSEFGTRRRESYNTQKQVVAGLKNCSGPALVGTSNLHLAMLNDLTPMGTVAHELFQLYGAMFGYQMANGRLMEDWVSVYNGDLGIALTDTFTTDVFLRSFNTKFAKLFDGVRHDSDDPIKWVDKIIKHYKGIRVNPQFKTALFSDNLKSLSQVWTIHEACKGEIRDAYGIGTWLSNDCGVKPLNIVIKLTSCDFGSGWTPTVKLSDNLGKNTGDTEAVRLCKQTLGIKEN